MMRSTGSPFSEYSNYSRQESVVLYSWAAFDFCEQRSRIDCEPGEEGVALVMQSLCECACAIQVYLSDRFVSRLLAVYVQTYFDVSKLSLNKKSIADRMNMSDRSLHRRMEEKKVLHQKMKDDVRKIFSIHYLVNEKLSSQEVAKKMMFGSSSSFISAFRRWFQTTPSDAVRIFGQGQSGELLLLLNCIVGAISKDCARGTGLTDKNASAGP